MQCAYREGRRTLYCSSGLARTASMGRGSVARLGLAFCSTSSLHSADSLQVPTTSRKVDRNVRRSLSTSAKRLMEAGETKSKQSITESALALYQAPLSKTFYRLKLFSLSSLTLAAVFCPVLMLAPGSIGMAGRIGLCITALATSGASTGLFAWIGKPYVTEMQLLSGPASKDEFQKDLPIDGAASDIAMRSADRPAIQVITTNWRLQGLLTTIYEPSLIRPTSRPFATWELPVTPLNTAIQPSKDQKSITQLVAATRNIKSGKIIGRWWARWTRDADSKDNAWRSDGPCREEGKVIRHFSIHEELLDEQWQVL